MTAAERRRPANRRPLHDDEAGPLEVLNQALGDDRRHELVGVADALAALKAQPNASASATSSAVAGDSASRSSGIGAT
jgi:hypothetical protein